MKRKIIIISSALLIVILGIALSNMMKPDEETESKKKNFQVTKYFKTDLVKYNTYDAIIEAYGTVKSKNKINVFSEVPGIMLKTTKKFDEGIRFSKGETLVKIDDRDISLQILSAKTDLLTAITNLLPDLSADYPDSYEKWKTYLDKFDLNAKINDLPEISDSKEKYFLANRGILKIFYNIKNLELRKEKHNIIAPFTGSVTESLVDPGTMINVGQRLGQFYGTGNYEVEMSVLKNDIPFIGIGNKVKLYSKSSEDEWTGYITRINENINPNTQTLKVFATINGNNLKDGMYLNTEIFGSKIPNSYRLPRKALYNNEFVYTINDSILDKEFVNILKLSDEYAFINGIDSNTTIVTQNIVKPEIGMKVKTINN